LSLADEEEHGPNPKGVAGSERVMSKWRRRIGRGTRKRERREKVVGKRERK